MKILSFSEIGMESIKITIFRYRWESRAWDPDPDPRGKISTKNYKKKIDTPKTQI